MEKKNIDWGNLGFGYMPTDKRYVSNWKDGKWDEGGLIDDPTVQISECAGILHYCQEIFEGLKAYTWEDGSIVTFRPDMNAQRMMDSAARMEMPPFPAERFLEAVDEVVKAIRRMKARKALPTVRSVTTDNGCEFLSQERLDRVFKAETYYTRAYASYEKGAIENCNRLVRRWYPKGTDFNQLTRRQIRQLEDWINTIHRESLNGETAYAYDSRLAKAA